MTEYHPWLGIDLEGFAKSLNRECCRIGARLRSLDDRWAPAATVVGASGRNGDG